MAGAEFYLCPGQFIVLYGRKGLEECGNGMISPDVFSMEFGAKFR